MPQVASTGHAAFERATSLVELSGNSAMWTTCPNTGQARTRTLEADHFESAGIQVARAAGAARRPQLLVRQPPQHRADPVERYIDRRVLLGGDEAARSRDPQGGR